MPQISLKNFAEKMDELMPVLIKEFARWQVNDLSKGKITLPQFLILDFLRRGGESRMTDLARFMKVSTAAMTGIVDRLVRDGYAARDSDPGDRRIIRAKLTMRGNDLVRKVGEQRKEMITNIFGKVSEVDRENYLRILLKIKEILAETKTNKAG